MQHHPLAVDAVQRQPDTRNARDFAVGLIRRIRLFPPK